MGRVRSLVMVAVVAAGLLAGAVPASASPGEGGRPVYYLSLGDSLAYGYQQQIYLDQVASGRYDPAAFIGYAGFLTPRLGRLTHGRVVEVNYGCPGETTATFLTGCKFTAVDGHPTTWLHDPYPTSQSQLAAAVGFLGAHQGQVAAVTVDLGSNDLRGALFSCLSSPPCNLAAVVPGVVATMVGRLALIAQTLEAADPGVPIAIADIYNPEVDDPALPPALRTLTDTLVAAVNQAVAAMVGQLDAAHLPVAMADAYGAVNGGIPGLDDTKSVCILTNMCTDLHDIHPSTAGYTSLSRAFLAAIETLR